MAKRDGERSYKEYKTLYLESQKELNLLQKKLDENEKNNRQHHEYSLNQGLVINNFDQRFESFSQGEVSDDTVMTKINILLSEGKIIDAENYFIGRRKLIKNIPLRTYIEGLLELNKGNPEIALSIFDGITRTYSKDDVPTIHLIYNLKGDIFCEELNEISKGLKEYEKAYEIGKEIESLAKIARCYIGLGQMDLAEQRLIEAQSINSKDWGYLTASAIFHQTKKEYSKALLEVEEAILLYGADSNLMVQKSLILSSQQNFRGAIEACKKAYRIDPTNKFALYNISNYYIKDNNLHQAEITIREYHKLYPRDIFALGTYFYVLNIFEESEQIIKIGGRYSIEEITKQSPEAAHTLGLCYLQNDKVKKAEECFTCLLATYPNDVNALEGMFYVNFMSKEFRNVEKADYYCDKVLKDLEPENLIMLNNKGLIRLLLKDFDGAEQWFNKALSIDSDYAITNGNIKSLKHYKNILFAKSSEEFEKELDLHLTLVKQPSILSKDRQDLFRS